jgi:hypothetical protein
VLHKCSAVSIAFSHSELRVSTSSLFAASVRVRRTRNISSMTQVAVQTCVFTAFEANRSTRISKTHVPEQLNDLLSLASSRRSAPGTPLTPSNYRVARKYRRDSDCDELRECGCEVKPRFSRRTFPDPLPPASLARRACVPSHADLCDWFQGPVCGVFPCWICTRAYQCRGTDAQRGRWKC